MAAIDYTKPEYYTNRELSWLDFNMRILGEARDKANPLFERLKFLSITASNLDEFFMIRVASLKDMVHARYTKPDIAGLKPEEQLNLIQEKAHHLVGLQYSTYNRSLLPALKQAGLELVTAHEDMSEEQKAFADQYFEENVYPVLTPMAMDSSRPFPLIRNKSLNIGALISKKGEKGKAEFATVQVPGVLPRVIELPAGKEGTRAGILLEELIERNIDQLFLNYDVVCAHPYRIIRNADLTIDEDDAADLLMEIQKQLKKRQWGEVIRLEVEDKIDQKLLKILKKEFDIKPEDIYSISGPLDLTFLMKVYGVEGFEHLKTPPYTPQPVPALENETDIFAAVRKKDIFLHHPYETFDPVVNFVRQAARDPQVLAIKQTLYRVSGHSPIVAALAQAAENGKQVSVLVELKARFDEENNIIWAKMLEKAGCHVIYGLVGLKTHSKITLVVRREEDGIRRYVHLGTGNYNDSTAKLYTDCGIMTCQEAIGEDATAVFNMLSGYSEPRRWNRLSLAPIWLRDKFLSLIRREADHAREGQPARIIAKMNSLCDQEVIAALYEASAAGVKIDLIIRGICCLKVGIPKVSENITVRSIVGTFLEHARMFYFQNGGQEEYYMGSADWMPRNLDKRVEILFPVEDEDLKKEVRHILEIQLADTLKAHELKADNGYEKIDKRGKALLCAQEYFCEEARQRARKPADPAATRVFIPAEPAEEE
ncbi:MAG TPA: RNA degradosome polyphosphate kinase [Candidatus Merdiplasma excrementigallinarum]|uniref:Polyphosphate kinase n=1 Tax=Candidatus Merdiplasma excrementigallinarum TaxID=2840864 RepID=A0A9D1T7A8_9FIRM|nr:RNA degradosome polyphosphate kinase [Candidatus Merdiplasma excrementigallinarum]